ncbi:hypothetical protein F6W69_13005 [Microbacterium oxydans]|uniref:hypothetical protein n=1 Tax=Microbacterium oxydans TaxID=82380 RepID=UPI001143AFCA|nr:hypothetical protein [Microbacterium oxydans]KAB1891458.1 hypothetical protein F6W69_13005 [Microbacterium oxydans]
MISPTPAPATSRRFGAFTMVLGVMVLAGCTPSPAPTPTPTAVFASEEEAFAAAEETFTEYVLALNEIDTSDPTTFERLFELSSGSVERADRENFSAMHAEGQVVRGDTRVLSFSGAHSDEPLTEVTASVCLDVSAVEIVRPDGSSAVRPDRPDVYGLSVTFLTADSGALLVDSAVSDEEVQCPAS